MSRPIIAAIDSDSIVYSCGFAAQQTWYYTAAGGLTNDVAAAKAVVGDGRLFKAVDVEPLENALHSVKLQLHSAVKAVEERFNRPVELRVFLTGVHNYRERVATIRPYKGNRDVNHKPVYMREIRQYLVDQWGAEVIHGYEADDEVSILLSEAPDDTIVVGIDKDLLQVPGWHYVPSKGFKYVTAPEGLMRFYTQVLAGDLTDNIPGCYKLGRKGAIKAVKAVGPDPKRLWALALEAYTASIVQHGVDACGYKDPEAAALETARLVWMLRERPNFWNDDGTLDNELLWRPKWCEAVAP